ERQRAGRFHAESDRRRFAVCRGSLRTVLGRYLAVDAGQLAFRYGDRGKPALVEVTELDAIEFNVAHSHDLALLAIAEGRRVGLAIGQVRPMADVVSIVARYFSARERAAFQALPDDQRLEAFFRCWTRKEAYLKATGDGLSFPLDSLAVSLAPGEPA